MYFYNKLEKLLKEKGLVKSDLTSKVGVSSRTIAKISKNEKIANNVLLKIANFLNCNIQDLFTIKYDNQILQILKEEKNYKISGGLYHELQIRMTYNSNHMEGSKLSEDETRLIFETRTINSDSVTNVDDIIETNNHFKAINYVIDVALDDLTEDIIKNLHKILKQGSKDSFLDWFNVGDYKSRPNMINGELTTDPENVSKEIKSLLKRYNSKKKIEIEDIVSFHAEFEHIHPFQDGNGRVGRLIILKECLKHNIIPFIIEDEKKLFYYRGLSNWNKQKGWLIDTCLDGQDTFKSLLKMLKIDIK